MNITFHLCYKLVLQPDLLSEDDGVRHLQLYLQRQLPMRSLILNFDSLPTKLYDLLNLSLL